MGTESLPRRPSTSCARSEKPRPDLTLFHIFTPRMEEPSDTQTPSSRSTTVSRSTLPPARSRVPSCPERDILAPLTLSTSRIPTVTPSPPESVTFSSLARATSLTSHSPRARVSSSPSPRKETRDLAEPKLYLFIHLWE